MDSTFLAIMRATHAFPINGDVLPTQSGTQTIGPTQKTGLKLLRVEQRKYSAKVS